MKNIRRMQILHVLDTINIITKYLKENDNRDISELSFEETRNLIQKFNRVMAKIKLVRYTAMTLSVIRCNTVLGD